MEPKELERAVPDVKSERNVEVYADAPSESHNLVVRNLGMFIRRLCRKHPDKRLTDAAWKYLMGEGLEGSILRDETDAATPVSPDSAPLRERLANVLRVSSCWMWSDLKFHPPTDVELGRIIDAVMHVLSPATTRAEYSPSYECALRGVAKGLVEWDDDVEQMYTRHHPMLRRLTEYARLALLSEAPPSRSDKTWDGVERRSQNVFCGGCGKSYVSPRQMSEHGFGKCVPAAPISPIGGI